MIIKNKGLIPLVIIVFIVVASCVYFLEEHYKKDAPIALYYVSENKKDINNSENETFAPIKVAEPLSKNIFSSLPSPNINPQFRVGNIMEYIEDANIQGEITKFRHIYNVTTINEINGTLCYMLKGEVYRLECNQRNNSFYDITKLAEEKECKSELVSSLDICVSARDGKIIYGKTMTPRIRVKGDFLSIPIDEPSIEAQGIGAYFKWLLSLKDNLSWTTTISVGVKGSNNTFNAIKIVNSTYTVVGREKVNNRECFKIINTKNVNLLTYNRTNTLKNIIWVDVDKRIIIKQDTFSLPENITVDVFKLSWSNFIK